MSLQMEHANLERLEEQVKQHEGYREILYKDTLNKSTIGYGHLCRPEEKWIEGKRYPRKQLIKVFKYDLQKAIDGAGRLIGDVDLPDEAKMVICNMIFQMGTNGVSKFVKFLDNIKNKRFSEAADEMIDSKWFRQTGARSSELAQIIRGLSNG